MDKKKLNVTKNLVFIFEIEVFAKWVGIKRSEMLEKFII